ncbi:transposase, partial [Vibrio sp. UCD-FRSSP16_10]|uniref:IS66 family insertion sequence element accessory protein TnpA n=1 Tax=Vibrio sp. UCD-FRSSP16_10 TaxID=1853257 RepID=UPI0007FE3144
MNQEQKRHHWAQILEQQLNSNSTIKQFCLDNGINYQTFHYWFKKLNKLEEQIQVQPIVVTENNVGYTASVVVLTLAHT